MYFGPRKNQGMEKCTVKCKTLLKRTFILILIGADTSLVEAAAIASRELKEEEEKTEVILKSETEVILKPETETPALSTQQPSAELEPAFIHSDDGKSLLQNFY